MRSTATSLGLTRLIASIRSPGSSSHSRPPEDTTKRTRLTNLFGWLTSFALVALVVFLMRGERISVVADLIPRSPIFWIVFALSYLAAPVADWFIFDRLWGIGLRGFAPLLRKTVLNALVVSYAGEAYFYTWARGQSAATSRAPFATIKDVAILSALVGNVTTLLLLIAAWPMIEPIHLGNLQTPLLGSVAILTAISAAAVLFRDKVFELRRGELMFVGIVHLIRTISTVALVALVWHLALPAVAPHWWLLLSSGRMVVSRLPLIANKDFVLAGMAALVFHQNLAIVEVLTMTAALALAAHLASLVGLIAADLKWNRADDRVIA